MLRSVIDIEAALGWTDSELDQKLLIGCKGERVYYTANVTG